MGVWFIVPLGMESGDVACYASCRLGFSCILCSCAVRSLVSCGEDHGIARGSSFKRKDASE